MGQCKVFGIVGPCTVHGLIVVVAVADTFWRYCCCCLCTPRPTHAHTLLWCFRQTTEDGETSPLPPAAHEQRRSDQRRQEGEGEGAGSNSDSDSDSNQDESGEVWVSECWGEGRGSNSESDSDSNYDESEWMGE